jgi:hypothetical protein
MREKINRYMDPEGFKAQQQERHREQVEGAKRFLKSILADGPMGPTEIWQEAWRNKITPRIFNQAKDELDLVPHSDPKIPGYLLPYLDHAPKGWSFRSYSEQDRRYQGWSREDKLLRRSVDDFLKRANGRKHSRAGKEFLYRIAEDGPRALQLLDSSPILAMVIFHPGASPESPKAHPGLQKVIRKGVREGISLKLLMRLVGIPWHYRKLPPEACRPMLTNLHRFSPDLVMKYAPLTNKSKLHNWLSIFDEIVIGLGSEPGTLHECFAYWVLRALPAKLLSKTVSYQVWDMADWVIHCNQPDPDGAIDRRWNDQMSWETAFQEMEHWHERLSKLRPPVNAKPFPPSWIGDLKTPDGWSLTYLSTPEALHEEGATMQHCVSTYWEGVSDNRFQIYSLCDHSGKQRLTVEVDVKNHKGSVWFDLVQARGRKNRPPNQ